MHYYKRNLGDYAKKAGRLSMLEHGAFTLLIDSCYDRETFPTYADALDWTWARTEAEEAAVKFVLTKFFTLIDGVYIQKRIKEELEKYHSNAKTNQRIAQEREEKARKDKRKDADLTDDVYDDARTVNDDARTVNEPPPNQEPLTINHKPLLNTDTPPKKSVTGGDGVGQDGKPTKQPRAKATTKPVKVTIPDDFGVTEALLDWARTKGITEPEIHIRMEHFRNLCVAQGYTYAGHVGFYAAFQNAVNGDWAKLGNPPLATGTLNTALQARKTLRSAVSDAEIADAMAIGKSRAKKP